jgi:hypothetical protein
MIRVHLFPNTTQLIERAYPDEKRPMSLLNTHRRVLLEVFFTKLGYFV